MSSTNFRRGPRSGVSPNPFELLRSMSRYDFVLTVIPLAYLIAVVFSAVSPVSRHFALVTASLIGLAAVLDALFVNPPLRRNGARRSS